MEAVMAKITALEERLESEKRAREELEKQMQTLQKDTADKWKKIAKATSDIVAAVLSINQVVDPLNTPE
jgi:uncharacterized protein YoxC